MFFSILVDECRDSSGKEQMSVFFRYLWKDTISGKYSVHEDLPHSCIAQEHQVKLCLLCSCVAKMEATQEGKEFQWKMEGGLAQMEVGTWLGSKMVYKLM